MGRHTVSSYGHMGGNCEPARLQILKAMLDDLYQRSDGQFPAFFAACYQVYEEEMLHIR